MTRTTTVKASCARAFSLLWPTGWLAGWQHAVILRSFSRVPRIYSHRPTEATVQTGLASWLSQPVSQSTSQLRSLSCLSSFLPSFLPSFLSFFTSLFFALHLSLSLFPSPFSLALAIANGDYVASGVFSLLNARLPPPRALVTILFVLRFGGDDDDDGDDAQKSLRAL